MQLLEGKKVVLGVTGGVSAYKACFLARELVRLGAQVVPCLTENACRFVSPLQFEALTQSVALTDASFFSSGAHIAHVEAARGADLLVIAPATANTIAKCAQGLADNCLTTIVLASRCPVLLVPAMHEAMWEQEQTQRNLRALPSRFRVIEPEFGELASHDVGVGRFPEVSRIVDEVIYTLSKKDFEGTKVVVTAGPTREHIDPVRVITNPSSGKMGFAIAKALLYRGADVTLVCGPTYLKPPSQFGKGRLEMLRCETAVQMLEATRKALNGARALIMTAAVCDERPKNPSPEKIKKEKLPSVLELERNPDILVSLKGELKGKVVVGFAAETGKDLVSLGTKKLRSKGCDILFVNSVTEGRGFGEEENEGILVKKDGQAIKVERRSKLEVAQVILDMVADLLHQKSRKQ